ncbi:CRISPR-associated protein Cas4 [Stappia taiwanensis]|uniref:CRISPR-associated exonuclease Cas4 n=1 Tax=Stappia taiwanensis TaxID=992267 RepID=A0A838XRS8_9HYPH|nr:CRISPR-associated protein Cas4 [Stappia taiwanensis]MBA4613939.1 CRISPR-associated protein Cas4 [Stappia taiwanensis]GGF01069.1 CRISPR-associated protein Cas4 [Stappia taiwanensis]
MLPADPIPISALQHAVYCLRQAALIHLERLWAENRFTAEGDRLHATVDLPGGRKARGVRRENALPLASARLGIAGVADLVEFLPGASGTTASGKTTDREIPCPVEFKRGKPKLHRADEVQLCAQGLCLEEMTGAAVPEGVLFYAATRRRVAVPFDAGLRRLTEDTIEELRGVLASETTPPAVYRAERCRACSLAELCRPKLAGRAVAAWRDRMVRDLLAEGD